MKFHSILFDLDGTLTDSGEGIINCASLALAHYGLPVPDRQDMRVFIGPPLKDTFFKFGVPEESLDEAVQIYRKEYVVTGIYQNFPYPGTRQLLENLKQDGCRLYVATSKPEHMAIHVLEHFGMDHYFDRICGACSDGIRSKKDEVIAYLLESIGAEDAVMVGDTEYDVIGATVHGIPAIGVTWGYGLRREMESAGALAIADTMEELYRLLS